MRERTSQSCMRTVTISLDSSNNIDSRLNITTFFNFPDMFRKVHPSSSVLHILKSPLNLKRARSYKVRYIALSILRTITIIINMKTVKISSMYN